MSNIPDSVKTKAGETTFSHIQLWFEIITAVRDTIYQRALTGGKKGVQLEWAIEEVIKTYPWIPEGEERTTTAFSALTYGVGERLWTYKFLEMDEVTEVDPTEFRALVMADPPTPEQRQRMGQILVRWPLVPLKEEG
jgi:hypothetical protein